MVLNLILAKIAIYKVYSSQRPCMKKMLEMTTSTNIIDRVLLPNATLSNIPTYNENTTTLGMSVVALELGCNASITLSKNDTITK